MNVRHLLLNPVSMAVSGLVLGVVTRLFDIYCQNLVEIFSQMSIWILLGTLITLYSPTRKAAMMNILPFCLGMLVTYYVTAMITDGVYGWTYIIGWTVFAFLSPVMAFFVWMTERKGLCPMMIGVGIVLVSVLSSILLFDHLRIYDLVIDSLLVYFIFVKKKQRRGGYEDDRNTDY